MEKVGDLLERRDSCIHSQARLSKPSDWRGAKYLHNSKDEKLILPFYWDKSVWRNRKEVFPSFLTPFSRTRSSQIAKPRSVRYSEGFIMARIVFFYLLLLTLLSIITPAAAVSVTPMLCTISYDRFFFMFCSKTFSWCSRSIRKLQNRSLHRHSLFRGKRVILCFTGYLWQRTAGRRFHIHATINHRSSVKEALCLSVFLEKRLGKLCLEKTLCTSNINDQQWRVCGGFRKLRKCWLGFPKRQGRPVFPSFYMLHKRSFLQDFLGFPVDKRATIFI